MSEAESAIRQLYEQALSLPITQRQNFVQGLKIAPAQIQLLLRMLTITQSVPVSGSSSAATSEPDEPVATPAGERTQDSEDEATTSASQLLFHSWLDIAKKIQVNETLPITWLGRSIAGYQLVETIGSGGSSLVFKAKREQAGVVQWVALKVFKRILLEPTEHRRFRQERSVLAQLDHPAIAHYIDGGTTAEGLAFIAMELIEGKSITEAAKANQWSVRKKLQCFLQVCDAVECAHRALIVHRDIKPGNVLVNSNGEVKLLDFGIAKFLSEHESQQTETEFQALTPAYAAPEQLLGTIVGTPTDVYSLGLLLCELLTEQAPNAARGSAPSSLVKQARLARQLRGDLDTIVLKATREEPKQRYQSAAAFGADVQRYLADEPILARRPSWGYVLAKFVQRNRFVCSVLLVSFISISSFAWYAQMQAIRATAQAQRADSVQRFLVDVFKRAEPTTPENAQVTVVELTEQAIDAAQKSTALRADAKLSVLLELGVVLRNQGEPERAIEVLRSVLVQAETHDSVELARAQLELLDTYLKHGAQQAAGALVAQIGAGISNLRPELVAKYWSLYSEYMDRTGSAQAAFDATQRASALCEATPCPDELRMEIASATARLLARARRFEESEALVQTAYDIAHSIWGLDHVRTADIDAEAAETLLIQRKLPEAKARVLKAIAIDQSSLPSTHWRHVQRSSILGMILSETGEHQAAIAHQSAALELAGQLMGLTASGLHLYQNRLSLAYRRAGKFDQALLLQTMAIERQQLHLGGAAPALSISQCRLGLLHVILGNNSDAQTWCSEALAQFPPVDAFAKQNRRLLLEDHILLQLWQGKYATARDLIETAQREYQSVQHISDRWAQTTFADLAALVDDLNARSDKTCNGVSQRLSTPSAPDAFAQNVRLDLQISSAECLANKPDRAAFATQMQRLEASYAQGFWVPLQRERYLRLRNAD